MEAFNNILTGIGMIAGMAGMIMVVVIIITGIIGVITKNYRYLKTSLKILLIPIIAYVLTIMAFAIGKLAA